MLYLKRNLPMWERAGRIIAGALVGGAILAGFTPGIWMWLAAGTAATLVLTAFVGFCPACAIAGRRYLDQ